MNVGLDSVMLEQIATDVDFAFDFDAYCFWDFLDIPCQVSTIPLFVFWITKLNEACVDGLKAWWESPYPVIFKARVTRAMCAEFDPIEVFYALHDIVQPEILRATQKLLFGSVKYDDLITAGVETPECDIPDNWADFIGPMVDKKASIKNGIVYSSFGSAVVDLPDMEGVHALPAKIEGPDIFSPGVPWEPVKGQTYNVLGCFDVVLAMRNGVILPFKSDIPFRGLVKATYIGGNIFRKGY